MLTRIMQTQAQRLARTTQLIACVALLALSGCAGDDSEVKPAELVAFDSSITVKRLWSANLGKGGEGLLLGLAPASNGANVYAASSNGLVHAFDNVSGERKWQSSVGKGRQLSAGPGVGGDLVVVGSSDGDVIALSITSGEVRWIVQVSSSVIAAPAVSGQKVAVRTVDGRLTLLNAVDGTEKWSIDRRVQGLTLRGTSAPVFASGAVISGFDNGKVAAIEVDSGKVLWEQSVTERRGRNELARLADVDGSVIVNGEDAFLVGYQGRAVLLSLRSGQIVWATEMSSRHAVALDWNQLYLTTAADEVIALDRRNGVSVWKNDSFANRELSAPAVVGSSVVVGDFDGYVHWMSVIDGSISARVRAGSSAIRAAPLAVGDIVYIQNDKGELHAFSKPALTP